MRPSGNCAYVGYDEPTTPVIETAPVLGPGTRLGDRYRLENRLGAGGMATVWLATDERLGRRVAVKLLTEGGDEEFVRRFRREAKLAAGLHHPNLVSIYDYDAGARPYLVMEYIAGGNLAERIERGDQPPVERLARELLAALSSIHAAGVLHRDVKPHNVLVDADGRSRLVDFGIALPLDATSITRAGHVLGTESYIAPEVRAGEPASERSDLYALGVLLARVAERGGASASAWALIEELRDPDPARRPRSASTALSALGDLEPAPSVGEPTERLAVAPVAVDSAGDAGGEPPPPPFRTSVPTIDRRRRTLVAAALAAAAIALVVGIGLALSDGGGSGEGGGTQKAAKGSDSGAGGGGSSAGAAESGGSGAEPAAEPAAAAASSDGAALNDEGFALINEGRYDEAIPVLQQAVDSLAGWGDELTYNYALFNLAHALRLAGRPEEAIPLLEQRLEYPDQQEAVAAELDAARAAAGQGDPAAAEKSGNGPPPWAENDDD